MFARTEVSSLNVCLVCVQASVPMWRILFRRDTEDNFLSVRIYDALLVAPERCRQKFLWKTPETGRTSWSEQTQNIVLLQTSAKVQGGRS